MRTNPLTYLLIGLAVMAASAGAALADGPSHSHGAGDASGAAGDHADNSTADNSTHGNETADEGAPANGTKGAEKRAAAMARVAELRAAREAALASFHENRTAAIEEYRAAMNATRESFLENKTRVIEACNAARNDTGNSSESAKCIRDGLKPLIEEARAQHKAARDAFLEKMLEARGHAMKGFAKAKEQADQRYGARDGHQHEEAAQDA